MRDEIVKNYKTYENDIIASKGTKSSAIKDAYGLTLLRIMNEFNIEDKKIERVKDMLKINTIDNKGYIYEYVKASDGRGEWKNTGEKISEQEMLSYSNSFIRQAELLDRIDELTTDKWKSENKTAKEGIKELPKDMALWYLKTTKERALGRLAIAGVLSEALMDIDQ